MFRRRGENRTNITLYIKTINGQSSSLYNAFERRHYATLLPLPHFVTMSLPITPYHQFVRLMEVDVYLTCPIAVSQVTESANRFDKHASNTVQCNVEIRFDS